MVTELSSEAATPDSSSSNASAICVAVSCIPLVMLVTVIVLRSGYPTPVRALVELAGLSLVIVNLSGLTRSGKWYACGFARSLYVLLLLTGIGLSPLPGTKQAVGAMAGLGVVCFALNLFGSWRRLGSLATLGLFALGLFLGLYTESFYWSAQHEVLYPEAVVAGAVHIDITEQAAIVNMISTYGVPSTGL